MTLALLLLSLACHKTEPAAETGDSGTGTPFQGVALREEGWLRGDLHCHSDAFDDLATDIGLAEYLEDPAFVAYHPEFEGDHLDFLAITNHNDASSQYDPAFVSDKLVLMGAEELSLSGHANTFKVAQTLDSGADTLEDVEAAVQAVHDQGGVFSVNHPFLADIPFPWDLRTMDSVEVWNSGWALAGPESTNATVQSWVDSHGWPGLPWQRGMLTTGRLDSGQNLSYYEALLSRGVHVAVVGGSDRHAVLLPGFPTTWVQAGATSVDGVLDGLRSRHTFVSRTPASAQLAVDVAVASGSFALGDQVPIPAAGEGAQVTVRVAFADGGRLQVVSGEYLEETDIIAGPLGEVVAEVDIVGDEFSYDLDLDAVPGTWFYVRVLEKLLAPGVTEEQAARVRETAELVMNAGAEDYLALATAVADIVDTEVLFDASQCDPEEWQPDMLQCLPPDSDGYASFYIPDLYDRAMNAWVVDYALTDWAMGAVGSAVLFVAR